jgi:hypothetical protein
MAKEHMKALRKEVNAEASMLAKYKSITRQLIISGFIVSQFPAVCLAQVNPKIAAQCKDARDFLGCVKAFSAPASSQVDDPLNPLRNAMKQVAERLNMGTSLRDSTITFQPVIDQLAIVETKYPDALAVKEAKKSSSMFSALQSAWDTRIKVGRDFGGTGIKIYNCKALKLSADYFDSVSGGQSINWNYNTSFLFGDTCKVTQDQLPESYMYRIIVSTLREGSVSQEDIDKKAQEAKVANEKWKNEQRLRALEPWDRYLEENPNIKAWVIKNPKLADQKRREWSEKNPQEPMQQKSNIWNNDSWQWQLIKRIDIPSD